MRFSLPSTAAVVALILALGLYPCAVLAQDAPPVPAEATPAADATTLPDTAPADAPAAPAAPVPAAPPDLRPQASIAPVASADGSGDLHFEGVWIISGTRQFYMAFGRWPANWAEVCACGLFQARLTAADGREVDPDGNGPLLVGDVRYLPPTPENPTPRLQAKLDSVSELQEVELEAPLGYSDLFRAIYLLQEDSAVAKQQQEYFDQVLADNKRLLQFAMAGMLEQGLGLYQLLTGDYPVDWDTFIASGYSPVGAASINPATGTLLTCDGSAWGFSYKFYPADAGRENGTFYFSHIDADGTAPKYPVMY